MRGPLTATKSISPPPPRRRSPQLERARMQQQRHDAVKNKLNKKAKKNRERVSSLMSGMENKQVRDGWRLILTSQLVWNSFFMSCPSDCLDERLKGNGSAHTGCSRATGVAAFQTWLCFHKHISRPHLQCSHSVPLSQARKS